MNMQSGSKAPSARAMGKALGGQGLAGKANGRGAASLLGKSGGAGLGAGASVGKPKSIGSVPKIGESAAKPSVRGNAQGPPAATKHPGKPETRRPTGRAVSGS